MMRSKMFMMVFGSIVLVGLSSATTWASRPVVSNMGIAPGQPAPTTQGTSAASGDVWVYCTWVTFSCATGSFDAILRQNHAIATHGTQIATAEIPALPRNRDGRSGQNLSLFSSSPGRVCAQPEHCNRPDSALIHTGVFPNAGDKVIKNIPAGEVQTGVFEGPERFLEDVQGDGPDNPTKLGFWRLPEARGRRTGTAEPRSDQGPQLQKRGWGYRIWSRSRRVR